jgi:HPt (histidine-containing phosphotransfer) domain-containing protein
LKPHELYDVLKSLPLPKQESGFIPIDLDAALQLVGGDEELLREAIGLFLAQDYPKQLRQIEDGIERQDAGIVRAAAHSIKGAAISLGGRSLSDVALRLEGIARRGDLTGAKELVQELEAEFKRFADFLSGSCLIMQREIR